MSAVPAAAAGATVVITHRVRPECHAAYEAWLDQIVPACRAAPGHLDWQVVRPLPGVTGTWTFIIRFDHETQLRNWMASSTRARLIAAAEPLLVSGDDIHVSSGLDFWFTPGEAQARLPVRWKQALLTWSAIFPLVLGVSALVESGLQALGWPAQRMLVTFLSTVLIVLVMVYVVMPRYTRWASRWLFR